jgi:hypothetical protein
MIQRLIDVNTIIEMFGKFPNDHNAASIAVLVAPLPDGYQLFYGHEKDWLRYTLSDKSAVHAQSLTSTVRDEFYC